MVSATNLLSAIGLKYDSKLQMTVFCCFLFVLFCFFVVVFFVVVCLLLFFLKKKLDFHVDGLPYFLKKKTKQK